MTKEEKKIRREKRGFPHSKNDIVRVVSRDLVESVMKPGFSKDATFVLNTKMGVNKTPLAKSVNVALEDRFYHEALQDKEVVLVSAMVLLAKPNDEEKDGDLYWCQQVADGFYAFDSKPACDYVKVTERTPDTVARILSDTFSLPINRFDSEKANVCGYWYEDRSRDKVPAAGTLILYHVVKLDEKDVPTLPNNSAWFNLDKLYAINSEGLFVGGKDGQNAAVLHNHKELFGG